MTRYSKFFLFLLLTVPVFCLFCYNGRKNKPVRGSEFSTSKNRKHENHKRKANKGLETLFSMIPLAYEYDKPSALKRDFSHLWIFKRNIKLYQRCCSTVKQSLTLNEIWPPAKRERGKKTDREKQKDTDSLKKVKQMKKGSTIQ